MTNGMDEIGLQRLVDGRMSEAERHAFLAFVDDDPVQWKLVALAFVEEQMLTDALVATKPSGDSVQSEKAGSRPVKRLINLAAMIVLSGVIGFVLAKRTAADDAGDTWVLISQAQENESSVIQEQLPVATARTQEILSHAQRVISSDVIDARSRDMLHERGYRVAESPMLYIIEDESGHYVIPQRHISLISCND